MVDQIQEVVQEVEVADMIEEVSDMIELLDNKAKVADVVAKLNEVIVFLNTQKVTKTRERGPESTREMTEDDARTVLLGDLKDLSHKDAAAQLGLSYGQVYSARKGFTFKNVYKEFRTAK